MRFATLIAATVLAAASAGSARADDPPAATTAPVDAAPAAPADAAPADAASADATSAVEPDAVDALQRMGGYLRGLNSFAVRSDFTVEEALDDGQKIMSTGAATYLVRMPDRLLIDLYTDTNEREFFYDGKTLTMYGPKIGYYASVPAPSTIGRALAMASEDYDIEVPLADLFVWGTKDDGSADLTSAFQVGVSKVGDRTCDHYAFRQPGADWQLWIEAGDDPLPCRIAITATDDPALPQYVSTITWTLDPSLPDSLFTFSPPAGAKRIPIEKVPAGGDIPSDDDDG